MDLITKQCSCCKESLPATREFFHGVKTGKFGLAGWCISCSKRIRRERHAPKIKRRKITTDDQKAAGLKVCPKCRQALPATHEFFYACSSGSEWVSRCKSCTNADHMAKNDATRKRNVTLRAVRAKNMQTCHGCKRDLPLSPEYFYADLHTRTGFRARCRDCCAEQRRSDAAKAYNAKRYNPKLRESVLARERAAKQRRIARLGFEEFCALRNASAKRAKHRDIQVHRAKMVVHAHRRRARQWDAEGDYTFTELEQLRATQSDCCAYCGRANEKLTIDHVIPLSRGGANDLNNLVLACFRCNRSKNDRAPEEWRSRWYEQPI